MQKKGFHPTAVFGRVGAAGAACAMLGHDEKQIAHAMGIAATTAGGLLGSFGTHCKPFHAGKAAMDGILAAQLAAEGFEGATDLFELEHGLLAAFIQDGQAEVPPLDFGQTWDLLRNGFKYFACCRATHSSTQAACTLADQVAGKKITRIVAHVHANALVTAAKRNPRTPFECKFSVPFCVALGLRGYKALMTDFTDATLQDAAVMALLPLVEMVAVDGQDSQTAHLDVYLEDGGHLQADTAITKGHPDNPMSWNDLFTKYRAMVEPHMGAQKAAELYEHLANFERPGSLEKSAILMSRVAPD
jgi:2-methylcitrate dehydratase PrpD